MRAASLPRQAEIAPAAARLNLNIASAGADVRQGDMLTITLAGPGADGVRYEYVSEVPAGPEGTLPATLPLELAREYFPAAGERRAYELTAEVRGDDGQVRAAAEPSTIRIAPGADISRLRPELVLR